ncbi:MAG: YjbE family putative metal transport protein [Burkholderiales bacterium]|nr:YjbE family putative metal transport protein [Burkholderiales bacterium]
MDAGQVLSALLAIIVIDIVLAGDNAIVIALAARALPARLQKRAIVWGAVGAIGVRAAMTVIVVWLLAIPGLVLAGGALLLWIAYRLLLPDNGGGAEHGPVATTFWGAMRTIVIADAVMGLDNVLAVAGAAHGSYLLVVMGLAISVPIVVWGSTLVLKVVDRYPAVVYIGAGVLVWTAVKMIVGEPLIRPVLQAMPSLGALAYGAIPLVLWAGFVMNHRRFESRIHARLAELAPQRPLGASTAPSPAPEQVQPIGEMSMLKVLVPVDGSRNALRAVQHAIGEYQRHHELALHLLNVQSPLSRHIARYVGRSDRQAWHRERAGAAMASAQALLAQAGVPHQTHWCVGHRAEAICQQATQLGAHHIVMGTARKNSLTRMLEDSVTNQVLEATPVPVEVVAGDAISKWERWGLRVGALGLGGGLLLLALD